MNKSKKLLKNGKERHLTESDSVKKDRKKEKTVLQIIIYPTTYNLILQGQPNVEKARTEM